MARKNALIAVTAADNGALTFTVGDAGSFTINPSELAEELRNRAMVHGIVQKISDAAAIAKADLSGDPEKDAATKLQAMQSVANRLVEGEWSKRSGDGSGPVAGIIFRAFEEWIGDVAKKGKKTPPTPEAIRAKYDGMDRSGQLALRNVPAIAAIMDRIRADKGTASSVDAGELLSELGL